MKKALIIIILLLAVGEYSFAQNDILKDVNTKVQINTKKNFTLSYSDTGITNDIEITADYDSKSGEYSITIVDVKAKEKKTKDTTTKQVPPADAASKKDAQADGAAKEDPSADGAAEEGTSEQPNTIKLHAPISYHELKDALNTKAMKLFQDGFTEKKVITDASASRIYLWLFHIRHFDDKAPVTGELVLNSKVLVHTKATEAKYNDYNFRTEYIQSKVSEYEAAESNINTLKSIYVDSISGVAGKNEIINFINDRDSNFVKKYKKARHLENAIKQIEQDDSYIECYHMQERIEYDFLGPSEEQRLKDKMKALCRDYTNKKNLLKKLHDTLRDIGLSKDVKLQNMIFEKYGNWIEQGKMKEVLKELFEAETKVKEFDKLDTIYNCIVNKALEYQEDFGDEYLFFGKECSNPWRIETEFSWEEEGLVPTKHISQLERCSEYTSISLKKTLEYYKGALLKKVKRAVQNRHYDRYNDAEEENDITSSKIDEIVGQVEKVLIGIDTLILASELDKELKKKLKEIQIKDDKITRVSNTIINNLLRQKIDSVICVGNHYKNEYPFLDYVKNDTIKNALHHIKEIETAKQTSKNILERFKSLNIVDVEKMRLQFERGFLSNIMVWVTINDRQEIFENNYAIGFSSVNNYRSFKKTRLYPRNSTDRRQYIYLSDVFANYENMLYNYTRDYSPADTSINNIEPAKDKIIPLTKDRLVNLFDTKMYTDLRGLSDETPNGLVQIQASKHFNINTSRSPLGLGRTNFGYLNYATLSGSLSKVEENNRDLVLRNDKVVRNNTLISPSYATNLDIRNFENMSADLDVNLLLYDVPDYKATFYINMGSRWGLLTVKDTALQVVNGAARQDGTTINEFRANTVSLYPKFSVEVFSEKRVGFSLSYQAYYTFLFSNNKFKQVASYEKSPTSITLFEPYARWSHSLELFVKILPQIDGDNKFFLRGRLFWQENDINTSFSQVQLGYSFNIFYKR